MTTPRIRNKGLVKTRVADIEDAPWNFRVHGDDQKLALMGTIDELGFYGYPDVYQTSDGKLRLCDGHLRKELLLAHYGPDVEIEVNLVDFDESEAKLALATKDPLAAMASTDTKILESLMQDLQPKSDAVQEMLDNLLTESVIDGGGEEETPAADELSSGFKHMSFILTPDQFEKVKAAFTLMKERGAENRSDALMMMAMDFVSQADAAKPGKRKKKGDES